jgi:signal peptidase II
MRDPQDVDVLGGAAGPIRHPLRWAVPIAAFVLLVDQLTKEWALRRLQATSCSVPDACIELILGARFRLHFNTGAAFSSGTGFGSIIGAIAIALVVFLFYLSSQRSDRLGITLLGGIAGGALGNIWDRVFRADDGLLSGAVIDFIDLGWWPVFNVADMAIVGGVVALLVLTLFEENRAASEENRAASEQNQSDGEQAGQGLAGEERSGPSQADEDQPGEDQPDHHEPADQDS